MTAKSKIIRDFSKRRCATVVVDVPLDAIEDALLVRGQALVHTY
jgi:hypothetical protein